MAFRTRIVLLLTGLKDWIFMGRKDKDKNKHHPVGHGDIQRSLHEIESQEDLSKTREDQILRRLTRIEAKLTILLRETGESESREEQILEELEEIERDVHHKLTKGRLKLMPATIQVGGVAHAKLALQDQNGAPMTIDSTYQVAYVASNPASVSVGSPSADGQADITGVTADPGNSISAVVTRPDGQQVTLSPDTLVIEGGPPPTQELTSGAVQLST